MLLPFKIYFKLLGKIETSYFYFFNNKFSCNCNKTNLKPTSELNYDKQCNYSPFLVAL